MADADAVTASIGKTLDRRKQENDWCASRRLNWKNASRGPGDLGSLKTTCADGAAGGTTKNSTNTQNTNGRTKGPACIQELPGLSATPGARRSIPRWCTAFRRSRGVFSRATLFHSILESNTPAIMPMAAGRFRWARFLPSCSGSASDS